MLPRLGTASCSSYPHAAATDPAGHCVQGSHSPLLFSLKPASQSHVQLVLEELPFVTHEACIGLPWQLAHTTSLVSEHGVAVYLPGTAQSAQGRHCAPVQNSMPLRHPPAARTPGAAADEDVRGWVVPGTTRRGLCLAALHGGAVNSAESSESPVRTPTCCIGRALSPTHRGSDSCRYQLQGSIRRLQYQKKNT